MQNNELKSRLEDCVTGIEALAKRKGCEQTLEFELYVVRWGAELAASSQDDELAMSVMREAQELGAMLEGDSPRNGMGAGQPLAVATA